jgi:hypothetical protein
MSLRLISLDCPACGSAMNGKSHDVIFFCGHCGSAAVLDDEGLVTVDSTAMLPTPGRHARVWRPAWVVEAEVTVSERIRADGRHTEGWSGELTFVIPAFDLPLVDQMILSRALTKAAGAVGEVPREPIHGGTLALEDALTLARHLVTGDEVRRRDDLASVQVEVRETARRLAAIPFEDAGNGRLKCAVTGVTVTQTQ